MGLGSGSVSERGLGSVWMGSGGGPPAWCTRPEALTYFWGVPAGKGVGPSHRAWLYPQPGVLAHIWPELDQSHAPLGVGIVDQKQQI